ncbi:uncharacterized protein [Choristoneura fumiferana]|uniref:uncharacterized protein n=1 Tax=Choristoneura fumiferana TaxID=7141 RepID=UPI003D15AE50
MLIYKLQIMGLSKVRRNGFGELRTPRGLTFLYSGKQDEDKARKITVIQCYAPTNLASEEDKEDFYRALKLTLKKIRQQNIVIVMEDLNAKVDTKNNGRQRHMGIHGMGVGNENGAKFLEFCQDNDLTIGAPNGAHHCSMCANAVARISTVTTTYLVVAEVRLKVALARAASATTKIGKRFEVNKLRDPDVGAAFGLELRNRFSGLEMDSSTSVHAEWNYILLVWNLVESGRVYNFFPIN